MSNTTSITVNSTLGIVLGQEMDSNGGSFDANQKFRGKYGPIRFYNRVLSSSEIEQNYTAQKTRFGL
jgi:pyruvate/2-oxoglutarate/acetoin dehydrogenase E1 component